MRVMIADDHTLVRAGLRRLLESFDGIEVIAEASDGLQVLDLVALHRPEVLILDVSMPGRNGLEVAADLQSRYPETRILIVSMHAGLPYVKQALAVGASGFLVKDSAPAELEMALRAVAEGQTFVSHRLAGQMMDAMMHPTAVDEDLVDSLTPRQGEVLAYIGSGLTTKQIASAMKISVKTVETHRARMIETLGLKTGAQLVRYAIRHGAESGQGSAV